jgi:transposase
MIKKQVIDNHVFLFDGKFSNFTIDMIKEIVIANSGSVVSELDNNVNFVVLGENPQINLTNAMNGSSLKTLTESEFLQLIPRYQLSGLAMEHKVFLLQEALIGAKYESARKKIEKELAKAKADFETHKSDLDDIMNV